MHVDSYNSHGLMVNGSNVLVPCTLLRLTVVQWNVAAHPDITEKSFSLYWLLGPQIENVMAGTWGPVSHEAA